MEDKKMLSAAATLDSCSLHKDGSASIRFSTQELKDEDLLTIKRFYGHFGELLFSENPIQPKDIPQHDPEFEGKTPSQRLRGVIFVLHSQLKEKGKTTLKFEDFYQGQLENLISQYKEKLDPR